MDEKAGISKPSRKNVFTIHPLLRKVVRKNVPATISKSNMGYDQYTVPDTVAVVPTFPAFLYHSQT